MDVLVQFVTNNFIWTLILVILAFRFLLRGGGSNLFTWIVGALAILWIGATLLDSAKSVLQKVVTAGEELGVLPAGAGRVVDAAQNLDAAQSEMNMATEICLRLPAVREKFGDQAATTSCQGQGKGVSRKSRIYADAISKADSSRLNSQEYFQCLAQAAEQTQANTDECYADDIFQVPQKWRLCMELSIQLPVTDPTDPLVPLVPSAFRQELKNCRDQR